MRKNNSLVCGCGSLAKGPRLYVKTQLLKPKLRGDYIRREVVQVLLSGAGQVVLTTP